MRAGCINDRWDHTPRSIAVACSFSRGFRIAEWRLRCLVFCKGGWWRFRDQRDVINILHLLPRASKLRRHRRPRVSLCLTVSRLTSWPWDWQLTSVANSSLRCRSSSPKGSRTSMKVTHSCHRRKQTAQSVRNSNVKLSSVLSMVHLPVEKLRVKWQLKRP
jgi:hypothetical protein